jgi:quercetin dioxygenase-like cupin family protein
MSTLITMIAALATFVMTGLASAQQPPGTATTPPMAPIKRTILQKADVPGTNLELIYATVEVSAGFKAGRHTHPGVVMTQVIDGDFWLQFDGQPEQILRAGESLTLPDRAVHNEGALDKPLKLIVVYVVEKGKPLVSPAP